MPSNLHLVHGAFAAFAFSAAGASIVAALNLGSLNFLKKNFFEGLCADVWDGFFLSPFNLIGICFLMYLPIHCYRIDAPDPILYLTAIMGMPSLLFFIAAFLETSPVILPIGIAVGFFAKFGWSELRLATQASSSDYYGSNPSSPSSITRELTLSSSEESLAAKVFRASLTQRKRPHS